MGLKRVRHYWATWKESDTTEWLSLSFHPERTVKFPEHRGIQSDTFFFSSFLAYSDMCSSEYLQLISFGDQSWVFIGRTDVKADAPILCPPHEKSWLIEKDPNAGKDWGQYEKGMTEDEMTGWHHWLNGHGFGSTLGVGGGQGGLACCDSWGHEESDMTEQLN